MVFGKSVFSSLRASTMARPANAFGVQTVPMAKGSPNCSNGEKVFLRPENGFAIKYHLSWAQKIHNIFYFLFKKKKKKTFTVSLSALCRESKEVKVCLHILRVVEVWLDYNNKTEVVKHGGRIGSDVGEVDADGGGERRNSGCRVYCRSNH
jgi:hypothetical protein